MANRGNDSKPNGPSSERGRLLAVRNTASQGFRHCWTPTDEESKKHSSAPLQRSGSPLGEGRAEKTRASMPMGNARSESHLAPRNRPRGSFRSAVSRTY